MFLCVSPICDLATFFSLGQTSGVMEWYDHLDKVFPANREAAPWRHLVISPDLDGVLCAVLCAAYVDPSFLTFADIVTGVCQYTSGSCKVFWRSRTPTTEELERTMAVDIDWLLPKIPCLGQHHLAVDESSVDGISGFRHPLSFNPNLWFRNTQTTTKYPASTALYLWWYFRKRHPQMQLPIAHRKLCALLLLADSFWVCSARYPDNVSQWGLRMFGCDIAELLVRDAKEMFRACLSDLSGAELSDLQLRDFGRTSDAAQASSTAQQFPLARDIPMLDQQIFAIIGRSTHPNPEHVTWVVVVVTTNCLVEWRRVQGSVTFRHCSLLEYLGRVPVFSHSIVDQRNGPRIRVAYSDPAQEFCNKTRGADCLPFFSVERRTPSPKQ